MMHTLKKLIVLIAMAIVAFAATGCIGDPEQLVETPDASEPPDTSEPDDADEPDVDDPMPLPECSPYCQPEEPCATTDDCDSFYDFQPNADAECERKPEEETICTGGVIQGSFRVLSCEENLCVEMGRESSVSSCHEDRCDEECAPADYEFGGECRGEDGDGRRCVCMNCQNSSDCLGFDLDRCCEGVCTNSATCS